MYAREEDMSDKNLMWTRNYYGWLLRNDSSKLGSLYVKSAGGQYFPTIFVGSELTSEYYCFHLIYKLNSYKEEGMS